MDRKRIFELDVLRGFAILLVMGVHIPAYPIWSTFGGFGVDLFFVLSGFLISNLLFTEYKNTGHVRLARFFMRRALKLYPSFYLLLIVTVVYGFVGHVAFDGRQLLGETLLTQNYIGAIWGHTWSLAVEEHFYILLPLVLLLMMKLGKGSADPFRAMPWLFLATAVLCLLLRVGNRYWHPEFSHQTHYEPSHLRFDSLFFGVFLSYLHNFRVEWLRRVLGSGWRFPISAVSVLGLMPALVLPYSDPVVYTIGFTLLYISFGTMLLLSIYKEPGRRVSPPGLVTRGIARVGFYSYTIYLWHVPMAQVFAEGVAKFVTLNQYLLHAIYFAASIGVGIAASRLAEIPILKLRERILPASIDGNAKPPLARELVA